MIDSLLTTLRKPSITNRPPGAGEIRRNDIAVLLVVLFAFFLGWSLRTQVSNASRAISLGDDLPTVRYPAGWITGQPEFLHFQATNPTSISSFNAQIDVHVRDLQADESLDIARANWGLRRSRELLQYRELSVAPVTVLTGLPGLHIRFGYVADPTRESGATGLPVVVEGQDLLFLYGDKLVVITVSADAHDWEIEQEHFQIVFDSLNMNTAESEPAIITPVEGGER
jgi:hypothetical protein